MKTQLRCVNCGAPFERESREAKRTKAKNYRSYCSFECFKAFALVTLICNQCGTTFERKKGILKNNDRKKKSSNVFCSHSCSATYHNAHKTSGTRRSKLEVWLEEQLRTLYPTLEILFNQTKAIDAELDIYFSSLNLAFELNGIFHYEPIFGLEKLGKTQTNDHRKFAACAEQGIELCIIDVSAMTYFKPTKGQKFLDIITNIVERKMKTHEREN